MKLEVRPNDEFEKAVRDSMDALHEDVQETGDEGDEDDKRTSFRMDEVREVAHQVGGYGTLLAIVASVVGVASDYEDGKNGIHLKKAAFHLWKAIAEYEHGRKKGTKDWLIAYPGFGNMLFHCDRFRNKKDACTALEEANNTLPGHESAIVPGKGGRIRPGLYRVVSESNGRKYVCYVGTRKELQLEFHVKIPA